MPWLRASTPRRWCEGPEAEDGGVTKASVDIMVFEKEGPRSLPRSLNLLPNLTASVALDHGPV